MLHPWPKRNTHKKILTALFLDVIPFNALLLFVLLHSDVFEKIFFLQSCLTTTAHITYPWLKFFPVRDSLSFGNSLK